MQTNKQYLFSVGSADEERLRIQNRLCDPYTDRFVQAKLPDLTGKTVLDVGCGTGVVSCFWAKKVGKTGHVIAIDISAEQIEIARNTARYEGHDNITFMQADANELEKIQDKFDLVYCRFFLLHVLNQQAIQEKMLFCVKFGGHLFCEEVMSYDSFLSDPDSRAFQSWKSLILEQPKISKTNYFIGRNLNSIFNHLNLKEIQSEICQPIIREEQDKGYFYLGFTEQAKKKFVDAGITTKENLDKIIEDLQEEILNKPWTGSAVQYVQVLGMKQIY